MSYADKHRYTSFPVEGGLFAKLPGCIDQVREGPIFPYYQGADFSTLEGFVTFTDHFGLDGFQEFSELLKKEVARWKDARVKNIRYKRPIAKSLITRTWEEVKDKAIEGQDKLSRFWKFQQHLEHNETLRVFNPNIRLKDGKIAQTAASLDFLFEHYGNLEEVNAYLREISLKREIGFLRGLGLMSWEFATPPKGLPVAFTDVPTETVRNLFEQRWEYPSIIHRCFSEIAWLIIDGKQVKPCKCCKKPFVTSRKNEDYCNRIYLDEKRMKEYEARLTKEPGVSKEAKQALERVTAWTDRTNFSTAENLRDARLAEEIFRAEENQAETARAYRDRQTCKRIGPQITRREKFTGKEKFIEKQRKHFLNRLSYLKKTKGKTSKEYHKEQLAFEKFKLALDKEKMSHG